MRATYLDLREGDCLLYGQSDLFGALTCLKTWSDTAHVEIYAGAGYSVASRNGKGVGRYFTRYDQLLHVLRPKTEFNHDAAQGWFYREACGQKYDWLGLLCFTLAVKQGAPDKMFCSEFAAKYYRAGGFDPFHPGWHADKIAPGNFLMSPAFDWFWSAPPRA